MKSNLLDIVISSGLNFIIPELNNYQDIPNNVFGLFITLKRSKYDKLDEWPEDVHGCIGNWNTSFKNMENNDIMENITKLSNSATYSDSRNSHFDTIYQDAHAEYNLTFMLNPIVVIDNKGILETGTPFNNVDYGIIVEDSNGNKATYLPDVFPGKSWDYIKKRLLKKANSKANTKFYAYKTKKYSKKIIELFDKEYLTIYKKKFYTVITKYYGDFIPYILENVGDSVEVLVDKSQYVRNIASINDILNLDLDLNDTLKQKIVENLNYYIVKFNKNNRKMRQASSFLIIALKYLDIENSTISTICDYLYQSISDLEPKFELGEVLISLCIVCPRIDILLEQQEKMLKSLKGEYNIRDIFEYNWHAKYLYTLYKYFKQKVIKNTSFLKHVNLLLKRLVEMKNNDIDDKIQTNYLAVAFEAFSSLKPLVSGNILINVDNSLLDLFTKLSKRNNDGVFTWYNKKTARIDITGHVMNGIDCFL